MHIGHVRMFEEARKLGDRLVVILNNDNWLMAKKGFVFMPQEERAAIIKAFACVDDVVITKHSVNDSNTTVCDALMTVNPNVFANGGDRKSDNTPESALCKELNIEMVFNVGGEKIQSSSELVENAKARFYRKPWGGYKVLDGNKERNFLVKTLYVESNQSFSLQTHKHRDEYWMLVEGDAYINLNDYGCRMEPWHQYFVPRGMKHRISGGVLGATIVEVMRGEYDEDDITRYEDKYGRVPNSQK